MMNPECPNVELKLFVFGAAVVIVVGALVYGWLLRRADRQKFPWWY